jgi:hypothetical protein
MQNADFQSHPLMRLTLGFMLVFLAGFTLTNFGLYFAKMNLNPQSVISYYNGSEEEFKLPRTYQSMLEVTHGHLAMMAIVLLMLTHLLIFTSFTKPVKIVLISCAFLFALLDEGAGWLVRFVHPGYAWLKVVGFLGLQVSLLILVCSLGTYLWRAWQESKKLQFIALDESHEEGIAEEEQQLP